MTWPMVKLGEVLTHRKEFIQIDDFAPYKRCRVQLHAQGVVLRDRVSGTEIKTKKQQVCNAGELLVAEIDAKLGGYGIVPYDLQDAIVSSHYFLFGIVEEKLGNRHREGKHDRLQKGKHRSTALRVAMMPPQGDKDAHGEPICTYPSAAARRVDHSADRRRTTPLAQDNPQGA